MRCKNRYGSSQCRLLEFHLGECVAMDEGGQVRPMPCITRTTESYDKAIHRPEVTGCVSCANGPAKHDASIRVHKCPVVGLGNTDKPDIMIVGPGPSEAKPNHGAGFNVYYDCADKYVAALVELYGKVNVYLTSSVKCPSWYDHPRGRSLVDHCAKTHLAREIMLIKPDSILAIGRAARCAVMQCINAGSGEFAMPQSSMELSLSLIQTRGVTVSCDSPSVTKLSPSDWAAQIKGVVDFAVSTSTHRKW